MRNRLSGAMMNDEQTTILLIEDDPDDVRLIQEMLDETGDSWDLEIADQLSIGLERLADNGADLVLLDLGLPDSQGLDTLTQVQMHAPEAAAVVLVDPNIEPLAIEALKEGAQSYLIKGQMDRTMLAHVIRGAVGWRSSKGLDASAEGTPWESQGDYQDMIDNASDLIQSISPDGRILYVNRAWQEALGYTLEEAKGLSIFDIIHPDDRKHCIELFKRILSGAEMEKVEARFVAKDGRIISVQGNTNCKFKDGKPAWSRGIFRDITEQKRSEEVLRRAIAETSRSQRMMLALSKAAQAVMRATTPEEVYCILGEELRNLGHRAAIFTLTDDREYLASQYINFDSTVLRAAEKLAGLPMKGYQFPVVPGSFHQRTLAENRAIFCESAFEAVVDMIPSSARSLVERIASMLENERSIFAPLMAEGEAYGILAVTGVGLSKAEVPAISAFASQAAIALENARTHQTLASSKGFLEKVIDSSPDPIFIKDRQHRILQVNRALCDIYGFAKKEILGKTDHDLFPKEEADRFWETTEEAFVTGHVVDVPEESATDREGNIYYIHTRKAPIQDEQGEITSVVGVARDITERKRAEEALRESEARFKAIFLSSTDGIVVWDRDYNYLYANRSSIDLAGTTPDKVIGKNISHGLGHMPDHMRLWMNRVDQVFETGEPMHLEEIFPLENGPAYRESTVSPVVDADDGNVFAVAVVTRDITDRKLAENELRSSEERLNILFEYAPDAYYLVDMKGNFVDGNKAAQELIGSKKEKLIGKNFLNLGLLPPSQLPKASALLAKNLIGQPTGPDEFTLNREDGDQIEVEIQTFPVKIRGQSLVLGIARDITERKQAEETIRHMAYHDALTGLPNRTLFGDRLAQALAHAARNRRKLAVMLLDVDNFKHINDTLGHEAGDRALQEISSRLRRALRKSDTVARWGGDEFIILLPEISRPKDGSAVAKKILEWFKRPIVLEGREVQITASIGLAVYPQDSKEADALISGADAAMYNAKHGGGDRCERYRPDEDTQKSTSGIAAAKQLLAGL